MTLKDRFQRPVEVQICVRRSTVDSFIESGVYEDTGEPVSYAMLQWMQEHYAEEVAWYAWENGAREHK